MKTQVILVNYRTPTLTVDCLRSLEAEVRPQIGDRVLVVDGDSGDGSVEHIESAMARQGWDSWASVLPLSVNGGFAFANNAAIRAALEGPDPPDCFSQ